MFPFPRLLLTVRPPIYIPPSYLYIALVYKKKNKKYFEYSSILVMKFRVVYKKIYILFVLISSHRIIIDKQKSIYIYI